MFMLCLEIFADDGQRVGLHTGMDRVCSLELHEWCRARVGLRTPNGRSGIFSTMSKDTACRKSCSLPQALHSDRTGSIAATTTPYVRVWNQLHGIFRPIKKDELEPDFTVKAASVPSINIYISPFINFPSNSESQ